LLGGLGNDELEGQLGNDAIDGGGGTDTVVGTSTAFTLTNTTLTGLGTDSLTSIEQARLTGSTNSETIDASAFTGATTLQAGGGTDTLIGGSGQNLFLKPLGELGNETMIGGGVGSSNEYRLAPQGQTKILTNGGFDFLNFTIAVSGIGFDLSKNDG